MEPSNSIFLAGLLVYVAIRGVYEERAKRVETSVKRLDGLERALLCLAFVGCLILPVVYFATNWLAFADYRLPAFVPWIGTLVMIAALWLFWRSHVDLGRNWSKTLELRKEHQLVRHAVYRSIRHPMYAAILLFGLGQGMLLNNWLAGWSGIAAFAVLYLVRTPREERLMLEQFGDEYREYMRKTGRLFPWIRNNL